MKRLLKVFTAAAVCMLLVFAAGCGTDTPQMEHTPETDQVEGMDLIGGSLDHVRECNRLSVLLEENDTVNMFTTFGDGDESQIEFFMYDGKICWADITYNDEERYVNCGNVSGYDFYCKRGERVTATYDVTDKTDNEQEIMDGYISSCMSEEAVVESIEDLSGHIKIYADVNGSKEIYVLESDTLRIVNVYYLDDDGAYSGVHTVDYSFDDNGLVSNFMTAWEETRDVTCVYERMEEDCYITTYEDTLTVPATWEVTPVYGEQTYMYMNSDMTGDYSYPGDGISYTIYLTNSAG